jgi:hypothetical protein
MTETKRKTISRSAIAFEYDSDTEHAQLVELLKRAIFQTDIRAVAQLQEKVKDIRGA